MTLRVLTGTINSSASIHLLHNWYFVLGFASRNMLLVMIIQVRWTEKGKMFIFVVGLQAEKCFFVWILKFCVCKRQIIIFVLGLQAEKC